MRREAEMMSDTKRSSTDPGGIEAPRSPVTGADAKRSFDTLVPTPEPEQVAPDLPGGRQVDTGESYQRLEARDAQRKRSQMLGAILAFAVVSAIGVVAIKMMTGPKEVQPAPPATVTVTVPVITTITVPVMTTATAPTVTTPVTATTSARALPSVKPSATATATATATTTASVTPSAKPSASHDPDYIRDFHP